MEELIKAVKICRLYIGEKQSVTDQEVNSAIEQVTAMPIFGSIDRKALKNELLSLYSVKVDNYQILEGRDRREPWLKSFKAAKFSDWKFWKRYSEFLINEKGFSPDVIFQLDRLTDLELDKLFNPRRQDIVICKKGLVVGQVQSGKTSNYTGLICKAADAGFNLFIVLAGIHNNLRSQTQARLDEGFLGFDTQITRAYEMNQSIQIGVGKNLTYIDAIAHSYTTSLDNGDFTSRSANAAGFNFKAPQPVIMVVKKNSTILKRLYTWLQAQSKDGKIDYKAMLMIDDEADNASVNTNRSDEDPTTINGRIRDIIALFTRCSYVGYTATPFANIFISLNDSDLFPKDFIINIPAPSNYIGPEKVFGTSIIPDENEELLPIVNIINDSESFVPSKHRRNDSKPTVEDIPDSLKTAIKCFIVTCAVRIARGQGKMHNSMLVHVTRYKIWQERVKNIIEELFAYYKNEIEAEDSDILEEFRCVFEEDNNGYKSFCTVTKEILDSRSLSAIDKGTRLHTWNEIRPCLYEAVQKIEVKAINGSSADSLTYYEHEKEGLSVIAVGGDKLSRGLTLEGLSVSYFLRASKMYDTLMQMGRWFGYRPGYMDLCRLFTTSELNEWYRHISLATAELNEEFTYLSESGGTPDNFALMVRTHPGQLQITSVKKMQSATSLRVSWAGRLVETYQLLRNPGDKRHNLVKTDNFLCALGEYAVLEDDCRLWTDIPSDVVCDYLSQFRLPSTFRRNSFDLICKYIEDLNHSGELTSWRVALMSKKDRSKAVYSFTNGIKVGCFKRSGAQGTNADIYFIRNNHILGSQSDEFVDLSKETRDQALTRTKELKKDSKKPWNKSYPAPEIVRQEFRSPKNPLLIIYPLDPYYSIYVDEKTNKTSGGVLYSHEDEPFIGLAISFPRSTTSHAVEYMVNQVAEYKESENWFDKENDNIYER